MFSLNSVRPCSSRAFPFRSLEEPPVQERGRRLGGDGLQQVHLFRVQRIQALLAAHSQDGDRLALDDAREVVGEVQGRGLGSLLAALGVHGSARGQAGHERAPERADVRPRIGRAPERPEDAERPVGLGQQDGHRLEAQRVGHARQQPVARARQVEVVVQVLGQPQERLPRAVALPVEEAVDPVLDPALHRAEEQDHHQAREHRDDRAVGLVFRQHRVHDSEGEQADPYDRRHRQGVGDRPPEDELDVHEPVLHDRVSQGKRNEGEGDRAQSSRTSLRLPAEGERHGVEQKERHHRRPRAEDQPLHLPPVHEVPRPAVGVEEDQEGQGEEDAEVERLHPVDRVRDAPQLVAGARLHEEDLARHRRPRERERGHVGEGHQHGPGAREAPLGEGKAEVQEHHGQEENSEVVRPEERPIDGVEPARVGRRVDEEEEDADRVEVQAVAVHGPPQHDDGADGEAEEADEGEVVEEVDGALGQWPHEDLERALLVGAEDLVADARAALTASESALDVGHAADFHTVDGQRDVAHCAARPGRPVRPGPRGSPPLPRALASRRRRRRAARTTP